MDSREYKIEVIKLVISIVGLSGLAVGGTFTYLTYKQHANDIHPLSPAHISGLCGYSWRT